MTEDDDVPEGREFLQATAAAFGFSGAQTEEALDALGDKISTDELLDWLNEHHQPRNG